jgi:hypothetical protein
MEAYVTRTFAHFFESLPADDAPYALQGVDRELPFDDEVNSSFSGLETELDTYRGQPPAYKEEVSGPTLAGFLEQSESVVDIAVIEEDTAVDRELQDAEAAVDQLRAADSELFRTVAEDGNEPHRYDPFLLIDDHDDYLSYTAVIVGAENYLGCKERKLVLPSAILAYSGTINTNSDPATVVEEATGAEQQNDGVPYHKYEATMDRLADDAAATRQMIDAAETYQMLHPDCDTGTFYIDAPESMRARQAQAIIAAVTDLGQTSDGFSGDVVRMKLANNDILLTDMLDTDAEDIAEDLNQPPCLTYLTDHPDTPLRHVLPGEFAGNAHGMPLSHPDNEPYHDLIKDIAAAVDSDRDPQQAVDDWAATVSWKSSVDEPDHVSRMYQ